MATTKGIDVSVWQGNVDFSKVKASGIDFVIIRSGYGRLSSQKDTKFETYYTAAKKAGLKIGTYWYSYAKSAAEAKLEANACLSCIKGKSFDIPVYFDVEDSTMSGLSKSTLTSIVTAFCDTIKAAGYKAGVYANLNWFNNKLDYSTLKSKYSIWLAQWSSSKSKDCDIWQFADNGKVNGISGNVDMNYCYTDFGKATKTTTSAKTTSTKTTTAKTTTAKSATVKAGTKLTLKSVPLYASSTATTKANTLTGTYYLWSADKVNNRYRITNSTVNVGKTGQVTGWIDSKYVTTTATTSKSTSTSSAKTIKVGGKVKVKKAVTYDGKAFTAYYDKYDVIEVSGDRVVIGIGKTVTAAVKASNLTAV